MRAAIYDTVTGQISRFVDTPADHIHLQCEEGEEFYLNCPREATHIIDDLPVTRPQPDTILMVEIRNARNSRLTASDWTQMPDVPLSAEMKAAWATYRQGLRDFPSTCDPQNPVWPTPPPVAHSENSE